MKKLLEIECFGGIDADSDDILIRCFEDHEAFKALLELKNFLIVGRKGSGKTSIFKKLLLNRTYDFFCFGHTFTDYPWEYHDRQVKLGIPDQDKFTHSWKYFVLLTLSKIVLNQDQSLPYDEESLKQQAKIEQFVIDTYGTRDPDVTQIFSPTKVLRLKPHIDFDFKLLKAGISPEQVPMEELPTIIQEVNQNLTTAVLSCLNPAHKYYVCFDQLDLGFDPGSPDYMNRLIGLLLAARDINLKAKEIGKKLLVVIFLRNDIYDNLHFEDKNKITENHLSTIEWDTQTTSKTLKGLMEKRFALLLGEGENVNWDEVFDETKEMTGHQSKYQHILDRTYLRPRDIIKFCNQVLVEYKNRLKSEPDSNLKFDNADLIKAKTSYSDYFLRELDDEIHKHLPKYEDYLEIFKGIGVMQFDKAEFIRIFDAKKDFFPGKNPMEILKELFSFSVIGFYRAGGGGFGGSEYVFKYKEGRARFDETAEKFKLHPGLMDVLGLKKFSRA
ncbi:MAG: hypothetical protein V1882_01215 [Candidatus Omnitrophota bacterium]